MLIIDRKTEYVRVGGRIDFFEIDVNTCYLPDLTND